MMKTIVLFTILTGTFLNYIHTKEVPDKKLLIETVGKNYERMILEIKGRKGITHYQAKKRKNGMWQFIISDSICEQHYWMRLSGYNGSSVYKLSLTSNDNAYLGNYSFLLDKILKLNYISTDSITLPVLKDGKVIKEKRKIDHYQIANQDKEFEAYAALIKTSAKAEEIKPYADTHAAVSCIYQSLGRNEDKNEISMAFECLSLQQKQSSLGKKISRHLAMNKFSIIQLPLAQSSIPQPIITSEKSYTLVVFSTSWCGPCRKEIPLLKKIYRDLYWQGLDIVYISMDEAETIGDWIKMIKEEAIPWKSFVAATQLDAVKELFPNITYPTSFLVSSNGAFFRIEIRNEKEKEKLYSIVKGGWQ